MPPKHYEGHTGGANGARTVVLVSTGQCHDIASRVYCLKRIRHAGATPDAGRRGRGLRAD